ncbi:MAG: DUF362 domain-containing protein [Anaerolineae bacterium]
MIRVDETRCDGCGLCAQVCPNGAIHLVGRVARLEQALCQGCERCVDACPQGAISAVLEPTEAIRPVPARTLYPAPVTTRPAARLLPWLGAALAFVGREVVPRVATALLDAWDRRHAHAMATPFPSSGVRPVSRRIPAVANGGTGRGRRQHRFRRRGQR